MNQKQKDEIVKSEIIRSAMDLFRRYGYVKTTMEDIAKAAGKGKSTLYYYYKNKDEVFDATIVKELKDVFTEIQIAIENVSSAAEKIRVYFSTSIATINLKSKMLISDVLRSDLTHDRSVIGRAKGLIDKSETNSIKNILLFGINTGEFAKISDEDIEGVSLVLIKAMRSICIDMIFEDYSAMDKSIRLLLNIFIKGLKS